MMPPLEESDDDSSSNYDDDGDRLECCNICGFNHNTDKCNFYIMKEHIHDAEVPTRARLTLPSILKIETMVDGTTSVKTTQHLNKGIKFGPLVAKELDVLPPTVQFPIKLFSENNTECYLDTSNENECNWMCLVAPALNVYEQNLICYQEKSKIFFMTSKDIEPGSHLKVWYSPYYAKKLKMEVLVTSTPKKHNIFNKEVSEKKHESRLWTCKFCKIQEKTSAVFAKHLQEHYRKLLSTNCDICKSNFESRTALRKHEKLFHQKLYDPDEVIAKQDYLINKKSTPQQENVTSTISTINTISDTLVGGPLLNINTDTLETDSNLLMQSSNSLLESFSITYSKSSHEHQNLLLDNESYNLHDVNDDSLLNEKELDDLTLELGESNLPQYVCDICLKGFTKILYLLRHLRQHAEEFKCPHCNKTFPRKENLTKHPCLLAELFACTECDKTFKDKKYLTRHMAKHTKKFTCSRCDKSYSFATELKEHNCSCISNEMKPKYTCQICSKTFTLEKYFRIHMKLHKTRGAATTTTMMDQFGNSGNDFSPIIRFICDICAKTFVSEKSLKQHKSCHEEPKYECELCSKKFNRLDVLTNHRNTHSNIQFTCDICQKILKSKKSLDTHRLQHSNQKPYSCKVCGREFVQRSNMMRHYSRHLDESLKCSKCDKKFPSKFALKVHESRHGDNVFKCKSCDCCFSMYNLLKKHEKAHKGLAVIQTCPHCSNVFNKKTALKRHIMQEHSAKKTESYKNRRKLADENNIENGEAVDKILNDVANTEVFLSMPELPGMELDNNLESNICILDQRIILPPSQNNTNIMCVMGNSKNISNV